MKTAFISEKAKSRFNLNFILSPITALVLMAVAETVSYFAFMPLFFIFIDNAFVTLSLELLAFAFISLAIILWARFVEKSPWLGLGIRKKGALKDFLLGWGIGAAMLTTCVLLMWGFGAIQVTSFQFSANLVGEFLILVLAWSIQGTTEELLTRGWMFSSLAAKHNIPVGILVSSLFFTFLHLSNDGISLIPLLDLTLFAILACLVMLKTGNLWVIGGLLELFPRKCLCLSSERNTGWPGLYRSRNLWSRLVVRWCIWCGRLSYQPPYPSWYDHLVGI